MHRFNLNAEQQIQQQKISHIFKRNFNLKIGETFYFDTTHALTWSFTHISR